MNTGKILITGACGQIGTELTMELIKQFGEQNIIPSDIKKPLKSFGDNVLFEILDITDAAKLEKIVIDNKITEIYHLASILSAAGENNPELAWKINMQGLLNVLNIAKKHKLSKIFWPSSIAVFGPTTPKDNTPQITIYEPNTVYGITKLAGERWCDYYFEKHGVDVRSIRYPGLISYKTLPGGGTTDYAVDIFFKAKKEGKYTSFLSAETRLPMMYMPDAIRGTIALMQADKESISVRSSYNFAGFSITPEELAEAIKKELPDFEMNYEPDYRQNIADSWPSSINDRAAQKDWQWEPKFSISEMVKDMLEHID